MGQVSLKVVTFIVYIAICGFESLAFHTHQIHEFISFPAVIQYILILLWNLFSRLGSKSTSPKNAVWK